MGNKLLAVDHVDHVDLCGVGKLATVRERCSDKSQLPSRISHQGTGVAMSPRRHVDLQTRFCRSRGIPWAEQLALPAQIGH